jgi:hypothetical protein
MKHGQCLPADPMEQQNIEQFDRQLLSFCQSAEWGMQCLQGSFGRLRMPLEAGFEDQHRDLLEISIQLQNLCTHLVGINQLCSMYLPIWKAKEIWQSFETMLFSEQRDRDRVH